MGGSGFRFVLGLPGFEGGGGKNPEGCGHAVVAGAADLGAEDGIVARSGRGEMDVDRLAWNCVLLETHFGDAEAVDDVLRSKAEVNFAVGWDDELRGDEIVGGMAVGGIETEGVAFAGSDEFGSCDSKNGVGAGVAEVPGKLHADDFDLEGGAVGAGVASGFPEGFGADRKEREEESESGEGKELEEGLAAGWGVGAFLDQADEDECVGQGEEAEDDPEVEQEMLV